MRFNYHKSRIRCHGNLDHVQRDQDDLIYKHFWGEGHHRLEDIQIQLIDRVNSEEELRDRESQWAYRLNTLNPYGLNEDDFFGFKIDVRDLLMRPCLLYFVGTSAHVLCIFSIIFKSEKKPMKPVSPS